MTGQTNPQVPKPQRSEQQEEPVQKRQREESGSGSGSRFQIPQTEPEREEFIERFIAKAETIIKSTPTNWNTESKDLFSCLTKRVSSDDCDLLPVNFHLYQMFIGKFCGQLTVWREACVRYRGALDALNAVCGKLAADAMFFDNSNSESTLDCVALKEYIEKQIDNLAVDLLLNNTEELLKEANNNDHLSLFKQARELDKEHQFTQAKIEDLKRNKVSFYDEKRQELIKKRQTAFCLLYTSPSPRDISGSRMPSSA